MSSISPRARAPESREAAVRRRYSEGAARTVQELCCPTDYDPGQLAVIPQEVLDRDYGCGDPSRHLEEGETVLDLGSGTGKICFIAAQVVGACGRVIGVDQNDDMLAVARRAAPLVAERLGFANVEFRKGHIEDLALDRALLAQYLATHPVLTEADLAGLERHAQELRTTHPLVPDGAVDVVVSNCVLNLVLPERKQRLFEEIFRVLHRGGRAVISDIVSDEDVPEALVQDPELWSGCVSGALREDRFVQAFERAGFYGIEILERNEQPWQTVEGIEFRSITLRAYKGKQGPCYEHNQAVIYKGPWKKVEDDDGHVLERGKPMAVCGKTFGLLTREPYATQVAGVEPRVPVPADEVQPFACSADSGTRVRLAKELKGDRYDATTAAPGDCCEPGACS